MRRLLPAFCLGLMLPTFTHAQQDVGLLGDDFKVDYYGQLNGNYVKHEDYAYNYTYAWLSLGVEWRQKVRAVITTSLTTIIEDNDIKLENDFSIEEFITDAYIEIREVAGTPVVVVVGKRSIPFASAVEAMPVFGNNPLAEQYDIDEVFGFSMRLDQGFLGLFDSAEISAFETDKGDLKIGTINGVSVRLNKQLTQSIALNAGHAQMGDEGRTTLGLITKTNDGDLVGWINGMIFSNNPEYPNSDFAITAGAKYQVTGSTDVVVEMTYVENEVMQYAVGTNVAITRRFSVGAEVRYNDYLDGRDGEIVLGANARYTFGVNNYAPNEEYLFDGDND